MKRLKNLCICLLAAGSLCISLPDVAFSEAIIVYTEKGSESCRFDIELAVTPEEQARGLMFRKSMAEKEGMFFVFDRDEIRHFWMRNTLIPLDMIFIDSKLSVVDIHRNAKPLDETVISSQKPARYVLEVNAGNADKCRIKPGSHIKVIKSLP
jgi:hypothetical protein